MKRIFTTALLILFIAAGRGDAEEPHSIPEYMTQQKLTGFVSWLVLRHEYYRALHELRRLHSWYPGSFSLQAFIVTEEYLLMKGSRFKEIPLVDKRYGASVSAPSGIFHIDSYFALGNYKQAAAGIAKLNSSDDKEIKKYIQKRKIYLSVMRAAHGEETDFYRNIKAGQFEDFPGLKENGMVLLGSMKSPFLAAALGIVPGMGYVYSGEVKTGIVSLVAISICASLSYLGFRYKSPSAGILLGAVATFFYTGSIAGGYRLADRHNADIRRQLSRVATRDLQLAADWRQILTRYGTGYK